MYTCLDKNFNKPTNKQNNKIKLSLTPVLGTGLKKRFLWAYTTFRPDVGTVCDPGYSFNSPCKIDYGKYMITDPD